MKYEFFTTQESRLNENTIEVIKLEDYKWKLEFDFFALDREKKAYFLNFYNIQWEEIKQQLNNIFKDLDSYEEYDYLYFGYTARYIYNAFRGLYLCELTDEEFYNHLKKIFEIQRLNAEKEENMRF